MKIGFLSDFFEQHLLGGAELNDGVLIDHLQKSHQVIRLISSATTKSDIDSVDFVIVSNFASANPQLLDYIIFSKPYLVYEHDHKYVTNRDPSKFKNFNIPNEFIVNRELYASARKVVCLSSSQTSIIESNLGLKNLENISCSLWSQKRLNLLRELSKVEKNQIFAIMDSANPIKNTVLAQKMCEQKSIPYELISSKDQEQFIRILSRYEGLVFIPGVLESLSRLVTEAKMMNCKIITTPKMLGASYEDWFSLSGEPLIDVIEENVARALNLFGEIIEQ